MKWDNPLQGDAFINIRSTVNSNSAIHMSLFNEEGSNSAFIYCWLYAILAEELGLYFKQLMQHTTGVSRIKSYRSFKTP